MFVIQIPVVFYSGLYFTLGYCQRIFTLFCIKACFNAIVIWLALCKYNLCALQVSKDGTNWTTLYDHQDDQSLNEPGSTATWHMPPQAAKESQGWRHIRLQQTGKNASGQTHYLSLSGLELYGQVTGVCEELGS